MIMYTPRILGTDSLAVLVRQLQEELFQIAASFESMGVVLKIQDKEPLKLEEGMVVRFSPGVSLTGGLTTVDGIYNFKEGEWELIWTKSVPPPPDPPEWCGDPQYAVMCQIPACLEDPYSLECILEAGEDWVTPPEEE